MYFAEWISKDVFISLEIRSKKNKQTKYAVHDHRLFSKIQTKYRRNPLTIEFNLYVGFEAYTKINLVVTRKRLQFDSNLVYTTI